jgi:ElaB/YqjD/DUF883 family membrane-anchored ribosome-binding protein
MTRHATHPQATVENGAEKLKQTAARLADDMQRVGAALKGLAEDSWEEAQGNLAQFFKQGKDRFNQAESRLESKIRADPLKAVLIAAGCGFVLAWLRKK